MKPKERFLNYALLSSTASCEPVSNTVPAAFKEDIPIDLSCKPQSRTLSSHHHHHHHTSSLHHPHSGSVLDPGTLEHIIKTGTLPFPIDPTPATASLSYLGPHPLATPASEAPWPIKYCYPSHTSPSAAAAAAATTQHLHTVPGQTPNGTVFPYLLLNPHHHLHPGSAVHPSSTPIIHRAPSEIEAPGTGAHLSVYPYHNLTSADHFALYNARQQLENRRIHQAEELASSGAGSAHSPPSSAASPSDLYRHESNLSSLSIRPKSSESPPAISAFRAPPSSLTVTNTTTTTNGTTATSEKPVTPTTTPPTIIHKRSHSAAPATDRKATLKKSNSYPNLPKFLSRPVPAARILAKRQHKFTPLRRAKSEDCLHLIKSITIDPPTRLVTPVLCATPPKSIQQKRLSDCDDKSHEFEKENTAVVVQQHSPKSRFHRHFRKEVIESWDNENKQANANNAIDLTHSSPPLKKLSSDQNSLDSFPEKLHSPDSALQDIKQPLPLPLDIYRQYYYYLMQEPAFASRAAAVAMAETYAKLLSSPPRNGMHDSAHLSDKLSHTGNENMQPPQLTAIHDDKAFTMVHLNSDVALKSPPISPDFVNGKTELRSADTTNVGLPCFDRKRISRPLTGKHVRHGTGASPATLVGLRNMIQQRQKLREIGRLDHNGRFGKAKNNKRIKRK